ncbi:hypothetical protein ACOJAS_00060 [Bifidobacterium breve]|uniref:hypothetical protein n=1 Tax=Bifidobacterium breve TaxID=1685 RepID=UPI003D08A180
MTTKLADRYHHTAGLTHTKQRKAQLLIEMSGRDDVFLQVRIGLVLWLLAILDIAHYVCSFLSTAYLDIVVKAQDKVMQSYGCNQYGGLWVLKSRNAGMP